MKQAVYFIAFGEECLEQFKVCLSTVQQFSPVDVLLVTDQDYVNNCISIGRVAKPVPPPNGDKDRDKAQYHSYFTFRTRIHQLIDITRWSQVWYMDCDFILKDDLFAKYKDSPNVLVCKEPGTYISNEHFCGALTQDEIRRNPFLKGINAGIYAVPASQFGFFDFYYDQVQIMIRNSQRAWLTEQHILNMAYVRYKDKFNIKCFDDNDIGFPAKKITGKYATHFACYKFENKLKLMNENTCATAPNKADVLPSDV